MKYLYVGMMDIMLYVSLFSISAFVTLSNTLRVNLPLIDILRYIIVSGTQHVNNIYRRKFARHVHDGDVEIDTKKWVSIRIDNYICSILYRQKRP